MVSYPLTKEGQLSHKHGFLRVSRATLLHLGASLKRVNGAIILENSLVPPCSILLLAIKHLTQVMKQWSQFFDSKFCIPLDFEILESSLPLYQYGLGSRLTYELTFADHSDVIKASNPDATYTISNISLEFDTVINATIASQIRTEYMKSSILYDKFLRSCIIPLNDSSTSFSVDINSPSKSFKGVLLIFTKERSAPTFYRDTEEFFNPKITKVEVTVEGVPHELYAQSMEYHHQYDEIVKHFGEGQLKEAGAIQKDVQLHNLNIASYYTDKYALWLDFRIIDDNRLHGSGR